MKHLFILLASLFCFSHYGNADTPPKTEKREIIIIKGENKYIREERSFPPYIEAWYDRDASAIEVYFDYIGEISVYIVDLRGTLVTYDTCDSNTFPSMTLDAPELPGKYYIVISSATYYGEGEFTII